MQREETDSEQPHKLLSAGSIPAPAMFKRRGRIIGLSEIYRGYRVISGNTEEIN